MSLLTLLLQSHVIFLNSAFYMSVLVLVTKLMSAYLICNETHVGLLDV
jgi:hypothetical protein